MMWLLSACTNFLVTASSIICFTWETKVDGKSLSFVRRCYLRWQKVKTRNARGGIKRDGWNVMQKERCSPTTHSKHTKLFIGCVNTDAKLSRWLRTSAAGFLLSNFFWIKTSVQHTYLFKCYSINLIAANVKIRKSKKWHTVANQSSRHQNILAHGRSMVTLQNTRSGCPSGKYTHLNTMFQTQASSAPPLKPGGRCLMDLNSQTVAVKPETLFLKCRTSCLCTTSLCVH